MKNYGIVQGGAESAVPLIIGTDTVYVHTNIVKIEGEDTDLYQYNEIQYGKDEYIELLSENQSSIDQALTELILGGM